MDGIINIYKGKGFTSHDVVAKMRGILRQKKIGHTGTLDPDATGVLPICLGKATMWTNIQNCLFPLAGMSEDNNLARHCEERSDVAIRYFLGYYMKVRWQRPWHSHPVLSMN